VKVERILRDHHECLRRLLAEVRSARTHELEPAFEALTDAVEIDWILAVRHLHPILERLAYPDLNRTIEVHRRLCHVVDELCNLCQAGPQFSSALNVLAVRLEQHIVDTERMVVPFLTRWLACDRREKLGNAMLDSVDELHSEEWLGAPPHLRVAAD
jgi:hypothetical protein